MILSEKLNDLFEKYSYTDVQKQLSKDFVSIIEGKNSDCFIEHSVENEIVMFVRDKTKSNFIAVDPDGDIIISLTYLDGGGYHKFYPKDLTEDSKIELVNTMLK